MTWVIKRTRGMHLCRYVERKDAAKSLPLLSELPEWYFSWRRLTHLWDSQQFVALGTPWKNRHIRWIAAHTVPRWCACVTRARVFAFWRWTLCESASWLVAAALWRLFASSAECRRSLITGRLHTRGRYQEVFYKAALMVMFSTELFLLLLRLCRQRYPFVCLTELGPHVFEPCVSVRWQQFELIEASGFTLVMSC